MAESDEFSADDFSDMLPETLKKRADGVNASHFFNNGCFIIRLWSEDGNFVWVVIVTSLGGTDNRFHAFFNLYKSEDAPEVMQTRIKTDGVIDRSDVLIVLNDDGTWKFFE